MKQMGSFPVGPEHSIESSNRCYLFIHNPCTCTNTASTSGYVDFYGTIINSYLSARKLQNKSLLDLLAFESTHLAATTMRLQIHSVNDEKGLDFLKNHFIQHKNGENLAVEMCFPNNKNHIFFSRACMAQRAAHQVSKSMGSLKYATMLPLQMYQFYNIMRSAHFRPFQTVITSPLSSR